MSDCKQHIQPSKIKRHLNEHLNSKVNEAIEKLKPHVEKVLPNKKKGVEKYGPYVEYRAFMEKYYDVETALNKARRKRDGLHNRIYYDDSKKEIIIGNNKSRRITDKAEREKAMSELNEYKLRYDAVEREFKALEEARKQLLAKDELLANLVKLDELREHKYRLSDEALVKLALCLNKVTEDLFLHSCLTQGKPSPQTKKLSLEHFCGSELRNHYSYAFIAATEAYRKRLDFAKLGKEDKKKAKEKKKKEEYDANVIKKYKKEEAQKLKDSRKNTDVEVEIPEHLQIHQDTMSFKGQVHDIFDDLKRSRIDTLTGKTIAKEVVNLLSDAFTELLASFAAIFKILMDRDGVRTVSENLVYDCLDIYLNTRKSFNDTVYPNLSLVDEFKKYVILNKPSYEKLLRDMSEQRKQKKLAKEEEKKKLAKEKELLTVNDKAANGHANGSNGDMVTKINLPPTLNGASTQVKV